MNMLSIVLTVATLGADGGWVLQEPPSPGGVTRGGEAWSLTLREALHVGLDNAESVRVICLGVSGVIPTRCVPSFHDDGLKIARLPSSSPRPRFDSEMMAHVRSIEQTYWALSSQQIRAWGRETAVKLGEEIVRRERAELEVGRGTTADVAEAQQSLERFQLAHLGAVVDLRTTERQLRNLLGLPPADGRRIVAVTSPVEAEVRPDWDESLRAMIANHPDIVEQRQRVEAAGRREGMSAARAFLRSQWPAPVALAEYYVPINLPGGGRPEADYRRTFNLQVVHQTTHALARFFLEVESNYKQFKAAQRLRQAAQVRLESARAFYEEGKTGFTVDRLLDAVSQYADAIAQEAQFKSTYNTSLAALGEARGTLLADRSIAIVEPIGHRVAATTAAPQHPAGRGRAGLEIDLSFQPSPKFHLGLRPFVRVEPAAPGTGGLATKLLPRFGTILQLDGPAVDFEVRPAAKVDPALRPASHGDTSPRPTTPDAPAALKPEPMRAQPAPTRIRYDIGIERGDKSIRLEGTITTGPARKPSDDR